MKNLLASASSLDGINDCIARFYRQARSFAEQFTRDHAVKVMLRHLPEKTPDGAPYSFSSVRAAMKDILS